MNDDDMREAAESAALEVLNASQGRNGSCTTETHAKAIAAAVVAAFGTISIVEVDADDVLGALLGVGDGEEPS